MAKDADSLATIEREASYELASRLDPGPQLWDEADLHDTDRVVDMTWLDASISGFGTSPVKNSRPLLVNVVNWHQYRPDGQTKIPNLLLASDCTLQQDNLPYPPIEEPA